MISISHDCRAGVEEISSLDHVYFGKVIAVGGELVEDDHRRGWILVTAEEDCTLKT